MERITIDIAGMSCAHCVAAVDRALKDLQGVRVEQVAVGQATVAFDPAVATPEHIAQAVADEGYDVLETRAAR